MKWLKRHPTSPNTYVFGFVEINSCEVKRESSLTKQNFFVTIMLKFNKVLNSRIILLILICVFLLTNTAYGIDLFEKSQLRKPLDFNDRDKPERYRLILVENILLKMGLTLKKLDRTRPDYNGSLFKELEMYFNNNKLLTEEEHALLLQFLWEKNGNGHFAIPASLIPHLLKNINLPYVDMVIFDIFFAGNMSQFDMQAIKESISFSPKEELFLWKIFHEKNREISNRPDLTSEIKKVVDETIRRAPGKVKILEIGCGLEGKALGMLKDEYKGKIEEAWGIDLDIEEGLSPSEGVKLIRGDIKTLPFKRDVFDLVYEQIVVIYLPYNNGEFKKLISEVVRVLRPGGRFIFISSDIFLEKTKEVLKDLNIDATVSRESRSSPIIIEKSSSVNLPLDMDKMREGLSRNHKNNNILLSSI